MSSHSSNARPLSISECREMLGWHDKSDKDIQEFLLGVRNWTSRFLDDYLQQELEIDDL